MATQIALPAVSTPEHLETFYSSNNNDDVSFLDRRADGRLLDWRTGLPPMADGLGLQHLESQKRILSYPVPVPETRGRGRSRTARDNLERIRYDMNDFIKSTVWANHDILRLRPSTMACSRGSKAIFVDGDRGAWLAHTNGEYLHIHDDADADGTTHMILSRADAATAIAYGWAQVQAHATGTGSAWTCGSGVQCVTVFPPRCAAEMGDWKRLVLASVRVCTSASQATAIRRPERL